ncbi:MAG: hypothetical protein HYZ45_08510 [Burkholderiales bacterium]|nr:hypothetical protein [Burkholderiales bacterium]
MVRAFASGIRLFFGFYRDPAALDFHTATMMPALAWLELAHKQGEKMA